MDASPSKVSIQKLRWVLADLSILFIGYFRDDMFNFKKILSQSLGLFNASLKGEFCDFFFSSPLS